MNGFLKGFCKVLMTITTCLSVVVFPAAPNARASTQNFEFESFSADYYLSKDAEGVSHLRVSEELVALFPDYNQNKGICRLIPRTNQAGANITLRVLNDMNLTLTRNGVREPIYSINQSPNAFEVCTGTEQFLLGRQVYRLEYQFDRVVTDFDTYQELYWDTNGTDWKQPFAEVTARLHFVGDTASDFTGNSWCYVGGYGVTDQSRCSITDLPDGVEFTTYDLAPGENLTFDVELSPGSFVVPAPEPPYGFYIAVGLVLAGNLALLGYGLMRRIQIRPKAQFYKGLFVKPEFTPPTDITLSEISELYIGKKKDPRAGVILNMIVTGKVSLIQRDKKKWALEVHSYETLGQPEQTLLRILAGGSPVSTGQTIEVERQVSNSRLVALGKKYDQSIASSLQAKGLVLPSYKVKHQSIQLAGRIIIAFFILMPVNCYTLFALFGAVIDIGPANIPISFATLALLLITLTAVVSVVYVLLMNDYWRLGKLTEAGLKASNYMAGLRLYISMAEADRLKFNQSVEGADVTPAGIVKLYERLLPYAAVLGLERSWIKELEKYYQLADIPAPVWYNSTYSIIDIVDTASIISSYAGSASASSSSSGGGGGGFSGGGGGGGGGGGR